MKLTKFIIVTMAATSLGVTGLIATSPATTAQAKTTVLKTWPKAWRGNWYASKYNRGNAIKFRTKTVYMRYDTNTRFSKFKLQTHKLTAAQKKGRYSWNKVFAKRAHGTIHIGLWEPTVDLPLDGHYRLRTKTYQHHKIKVLQTVSSGHVDYAYYRTKKLAGHFNH